MEASDDENGPDDAYGVVWAVFFIYPSYFIDTK